MRRVVWSIEPMRFFADHLAKTLGWEQMVDGYVGDADLCLIVGMYDPPLYARTLQMTQRCKQRIIHWCGTDVLNYQPYWESLPQALHTCESEVLKEELFAKGVEAEVCTMSTPNHFLPTPLPKTKMVSCYLGTNPFAYGNDMLAILGEVLPEDVRVLGYMHGQNSIEDMRQLVNDTSVHVRLTAHDGGCTSAREMAEAGRPVVISSQWPHMTRIRHDDVIALLREVQNALRQEEPDVQAIEYYRWFNSDERYLQDFQRLVMDRV